MGLFGIIGAAAHAAKDYLLDEKPKPTDKDRGKAAAKDESIFTTYKISSEKPSKSNDADYIDSVLAYSDGYWGAKGKKNGETDIDKVNGKGKMDYKESAALMIFQDSVGGLDGKVSHADILEAKLSLNTKEGKEQYEQILKDVEKRDEEKKKKEEDSKAKEIKIQKWGTGKNDCMERIALQNYNLKTEGGKEATPQELLAIEDKIVKYHNDQIQKQNKTGQEIPESGLILPDQTLYLPPQSIITSMLEEMRAENKDEAKTKEADKTKKQNNEEEKLQSGNLMLVA